MEEGFETSGRNVKNKSNDISFQIGQSSTNVEAALGKIEETEPNPIGSSVQSIIYLKYFYASHFYFNLFEHIKLIRYHVLIKNIIRNILYIIINSR